MTAQKMQIGHAPLLAIAIFASVYTFAPACKNES
jgi:hypothetical protein